MRVESSLKDIGGVYQTTRRGQVGPGSLRPLFMPVGSLRLCVSIEL